MNGQTNKSRKNKARKPLVVAHREVQYDKALDGLIKGIIPPAYVAERWNKLKDIRG